MFRRVIQTFTHEILQIAFSVAGPLLKTVGSQNVQFEKKINIASKFAVLANRLIRSPFQHCLGQQGPYCEENEILTAEKGYFDACVPVPFVWCLGVIQCVLFPGVMSILSLLIVEVAYFRQK